MKAKLEAQLLTGSAKLGISLTSEQAVLGVTYLELLCKWNQHYNLTAVRDIEQMLSKHLLDSLSLAPYVEASPVLDIGTGAGLPGIPLAIYYPEFEFFLLDSNSKKTAFLQQCKQSLSLANVTVVNARLEQFQSKQPFAVITSRAFSGLASIVSKTEHLCCNETTLLAMKGRLPTDELVDLAGFRYEVIPLDVPGLDAQRHLIKIKLGG